MTLQDKKIEQLEKCGWKFLNWIPAQPNADGEPIGDGRIAVMAKPGVTRFGRQYIEVEPDGFVDW